MKCKVELTKERKVSEGVKCKVELKKERQVCEGVKCKNFLYLLFSPDKCSYTLTILAVDSGATPRTATGTVTVTVTDVNDNDPVITGTYDKSLYENTTIGFEAFDIVASDADRDNNALLVYSYVTPVLINCCFVKAVLIGCCFVRVALIGL